MSEVVAEVITEQEQAFFWNVDLGLREAIDGMLQAGIDGKSLNEAQKDGLICLPTSSLGWLAEKVGVRLGLGTLREVNVARDEQGQIIRLSLPTETPLYEHADIPDANIPGSFSY